MKRVSVAALLLLVLVAALAVAPATARVQATTVSVTMTDLRFALSKKTVPKGAVTFNLRNRGQLPHDFRISGKKSPMVQPGKRGKLTVTFKKAGKFRYICTVPGHAAAGMKGVLTVR
jgi:uncharacterized cupredoxin-like copper-binding protein